GTPAVAGSWRRRRMSASRRPCRRRSSSSDTALAPRYRGRSSRAGRLEAQALAGREGGAAVELDDAVDEGADVAGRRGQLPRDRPDRVARLHDVHGPCGRRQVGGPVGGGVVDDHGGGGGAHRRRAVTGTDGEQHAPGRHRRGDEEGDGEAAAAVPRRRGPGGGCGPHGAQVGGRRRRAELGDRNHGCIFLRGCDSEGEERVFGGGLTQPRTGVRRQENPEQVFATPRPLWYGSERQTYVRSTASPATDVPDEGRTMTEQTLTERQRQILEMIDKSMRDRGYPPSVREIGEAVGLTSPSTVHSHLNTLSRLGFLRRDPTKPRAIEVRYDPNSGAVLERRPAQFVPLVGDVAAGTDVLAQENVEEILPLPADFTGDGELFMLRVRGDSMIEAGILDGDYVVARAQPSADKGDIVVAGIPGEEATVKTYTRKGGKVVLMPANATMAPIELDAGEVTIYGKVVTVLRRL